MLGGRLRLRGALIGFVGLIALSQPPALAEPDGAPVRVTIDAGTIEGRATGPTGPVVFKGVPFAEPPVGDLRWRPPLPPRSWQGVRQAADPGQACIQSGPKGITGGEDCLYLNVWAPEWPVKRRRPVMFWLFGGANVVGSANNPLFDGSALAARGVVVVTANFRVGVMGFLVHPDLSQESANGASGNYMLLDQIRVLHWIRDNIAGFGGDPRNVTVFGQSSGSYDLLLLMTSPLARGLFAKAIAQSGQFLSYGGPMPKARAEVIGQEIAASLKLPGGTATIEAMRQMPAPDVVRSAAAFLKTQPGSDTGLLTSIDGFVLREEPARVFAEGRQMPIPLMIGNNAREIPWEVEPDALRARIRETYGAFASRALLAYGLADDGVGRIDPLLGGPGAQWWTDIVQRCAANLETGWHAARGFPTWQYQFERSVPGREAMGATHGAELPYVFGKLEGAGLDAPNYQPADFAASALIQGYWTRFAATGNPNGADAPTWPKAEGGAYLAFTRTGAEVKRGLQSGPCAVYRDWRLDRLNREKGERRP